MPRRTRPHRPKVRRTWTRHPATRVQPSRRGYDRRRARRDDHADDLGEPMPPLQDKRPGGRPEDDGERVLGVDYGARRVGLAISDPFGRIAQGLETLEPESDEALFTILCALVAQYEVRHIVVGLPVNMDGTEGEMAKRVQAFARTLEMRTGVEVTTWDERLTSVAAQRAAAEMGTSAKGRKTALDRISATFILQGYLDNRRRLSSSEPEAME